MIDTENKRRSVIASGLDFMAVRPAPDVDMDGFDRRHRAAHYSGLETEVDTFFFWREIQRASGAFVRVGAASEAFAKARPASESWVKNTEVNDQPE